MSGLVRLHVHSQRPDPYWILSEEEERELARQLLLLRDRSLFEAREAAPAFGYRGFTVSLSDGERDLVVNQGIVDFGPSEWNLLDRDRAIECFLLETAGDAVPGPLKERVRRALSQSLNKFWSKRLKQPAQAASCTRMADDAPAYNPAIWNDIDTVRTNNNCYNYALNRVLTRFTTPGEANGVSIVYSSCGVKDGPQEAAAADGLEIVDNLSRQLGSGEGWYVALVLDEEFGDCHWYRQDASGCWSHKLGVARASDRDDNGEYITDPRHSDGGDYSIFCTFMIAGPDIDIEDD